MKDIFCSYYTNDVNIASYMAHKLNLQHGDAVLEPCAGGGALVDAVLAEGKNVQITAIDLNPEAVFTLDEKYQHNLAVIVQKSDFLMEFADICTENRIKYDKIIANPPFGAWQDIKRRKELKKKWKGQYIKESYAVFMLQALSLLKDGGRMCFIVPDTYMYLNRSEALRRSLLMHKVEEICLFPSKLFPNLSFGYSGLSILTIEKGGRTDGKIKVIEGFKDSLDFKRLKKDDAHLVKNLISQQESVSDIKCRILPHSGSWSKLISHPPATIKDAAHVVTGFYCGDNKAFLKPLNPSIKRAKGHEAVNPSLIRKSCSMDGISGMPEAYIPIVKSGFRTRYAASDEWYLRWDEDAVSHYKSSSKARFQNKEFYFQRGVFIPKIKSRKICAVMSEDHIFDQSVTGIFPKDPSKVWYMLALMNSDTAYSLLHLVNPTANNSAEYINMLPYVEPCQEEMEQISLMAEKAYELEMQGEHEKAEAEHSKINKAVCKVYETYKAK